jgi:hypothetical protein
MTEMAPLDGPTGAEPQVLYSEGGASWLWVLTGPVVGAIMVLLQLGAGSPIGLVVPVVFSVVLSAFVALQVKAGRIHASVELTADTLRDGTETVDVGDILFIYPVPDAPARGSSASWRVDDSSALSTRGLRWDRAGQSDRDRETDTVGDTDPNAGDFDPNAGDFAPNAGDWRSARSLGELSGVPRGRTAIGLRLTGGRDVQAWARRPRRLRAALTQLIEGRQRGPGV